MHAFRKVVIAASVTALVLAGLAAPVSAGPGKATIGIVNGIPNQKVDICVNGKELRSAAKYGQAVAKVVQAGSTKVQIRKASPGVCQGARIAQKRLSLAVAADVTLVITKRAPKWAKFMNIKVSGSPVYWLGGIWPKGPAETTYYHMAWRHAADLGTVEGRYGFAAIIPIGPVAVVPWTKGDQVPLAWAEPPAPGLLMSLGFGRIGKVNDLARSKWFAPKAGYRYELYLLGTTIGNVKVVIWRRPITQYVSP